MVLENILPLPPAPFFTLQTEKGSEWQLSTLVLASGLAGANSMKGCNLGDFPPPTFLPTVPWTLARQQPWSGESGLKTRSFPREVGRIAGGGQQRSRLRFPSAEQKRPEVSSSLSSSLPVVSSGSAARGGGRRVDIWPPRAQGRGHPRDFKKAPSASSP